MPNPKIEIELLPTHKIISNTKNTTGSVFKFWTNTHER